MRTRLPSSSSKHPGPHSLRSLPPASSTHQLRPPVPPTRSTHRLCRPALPTSPTHRPAHRQPIGPADRLSPPTRPTGPTHQPDPPARPAGPANRPDPPAPRASPARASRTPASATHRARLCQSRRSQPIPSPVFHQPRQRPNRRAIAPEFTPDFSSLRRSSQGLRPNPSIPVSLSHLHHASPTSRPSQDQPCPPNSSPLEQYPIPVVGIAVTATRLRGLPIPAIHLLVFRRPQSPRITRAQARSSLPPKPVAALDRSFASHHASPRPATDSPHCTGQAPARKPKPRSPTANHDRPMCPDPGNVGRTPATHAHSEPRHPDASRSAIRAEPSARPSGTQHSRSVNSPEPPAHKPQNPHCTKESGRCETYSHP